jgi:hypothetical protein
LFHACICNHFENTLISCRPDHNLTVCLYNFLWHVTQIMGQINESLGRDTKQKELQANNTLILKVFSSLK